MTGIEQLTAAYESMNPWARKLLRDIAEDYAKLFPAPKRASKLSQVPRSMAKPAMNRSDSTSR
ncbi:MAG: hypothetical protein ACJ8LG_06475 [Massilia sp.]